MWKSQASAAPVILEQAWRDRVPRAQGQAGGVDRLALGAVRDCLKKEGVLQWKGKPTIYLTSAPHMNAHIRTCTYLHTYVYGHRDTRRNINNDFIKPE